METRYIGVDLGGTSAKIGVVDGEGKLLKHTEVPTYGEGPEPVLQRVVEAARELTTQSGASWDQVVGIGMGLPGFLDLERGVIKRLTNLPWENVPIVERLETLCRRPVRIDNDANVAALGESWSGAGAGVDDMVAITLGTGVGGGVIAGGRLIHGISNAAGEIGHVCVEPGGARCGCGQRGCLETISSATGIVRLAREALEKGESTSLAETSQTGELTARDVFQAAERGDAVASRVVQTAVDALARVMAMVTVVLNPARFVIGGGVARAGDTLFQPLEHAYRKHVLPSAAEGVEIVPAKLGNNAGIIGAAGLIARRENPASASYT